MDNKTAKLGTCGIRHPWKREEGGGSGGASQLMLHWHFESQVWAPGKQPDRVKHHNKELGNFLKAKKGV
jgi:hypothetical protein